MSDLKNVREALIAEALGDLGRLLEQTQSLVALLTDSRDEMLDAHGRLARQAAEQSAAFDAHLNQLSSKAKSHIVKHVAQRGDEAARRSVDLHVRAMEDAAHKIFQQELGPALQRVAYPLQRLHDIARAAANPWNSWLTHAATAIGASTVTWLLTSGVWRH